MDRQQEFHFGAITHQHVLAMGQAEGMSNLKMLGGHSPQSAVSDEVSAKLSAKAKKTHKMMATKVTPIGQEVYN